MRNILGQSYPCYLLFHTIWSSSLFWRVLYLLACFLHRFFFPAPSLLKSIIEFNFLKWILWMKLFKFCIFYKHYALPISSFSALSFLFFFIFFPVVGANLDVGDTLVSMVTYGCNFCKLELISSEELPANKSGKQVVLWFLVSLPYMVIPIFFLFWIIFSGFYINL